MNFSNQAQKLQKHLNQAQNILLVIHQQPDADALGSLVAVSSWLENLNKNQTAFCLGTSLADCLFVDEKRILIDSPEKLSGKNFDTILVMDCGDLKFAGLSEILPLLIQPPTIINIDHHATNDSFGEINLLNTQAASTTEILFEVFNLLKIKITPKIASALLAGIINDTYGFTNPNTSSNSLAITSSLVKAGAKLNKISDSILKNKSVSDLQLWGTILTRLSHNPNLNIATTIIASQDLTSGKQNNEITEGIANFLNNLSGVDAAMVLKQEGPNLIKGSLRTNNDNIDVSKLAKILGGGGHKKAAGFKITGQLTKNKQGYWQII